MYEEFQYRNHRATFRTHSKMLGYQYIEKPLRYEVNMPVKIKIKIYWEMIPSLRLTDYLPVFY